MNYDLKIIQGNNATITIIKDDGAFGSGDKIVFSIKKNHSDTKYVYQKEITSFTDNVAIIDILPYATTNIEPGQYVYDVQFTSASETVVNTICKGNLELDWRVNDGI